MFNRALHEETTVDSAECQHCRDDLEKSASAEPLACLQLLLFQMIGDQNPWQPECYISMSIQSAGETMYDLRCFFLLSITRDENRHYVAVLRRAEQGWMEYNDICVSEYVLRQEFPSDRVYMTLDDRGEPPDASATEPCQASLPRGSRVLRMSIGASQKTL
jgi:hypothetical protein